MGHPRIFANWRDRSKRSFILAALIANWLVHARNKSLDVKRRTTAVRPGSAGHRKRHIGDTSYLVPVCHQRPAENAHATRL